MASNFPNYTAMFLPLAIAKLLTIFPCILSGFNPKFETILKRILKFLENSCSCDLCDSHNEMFNRWSYWLPTLCTIEVNRLLSCKDLESGSHKSGISEMKSFYTITHRKLTIPIKLKFFDLLHYSTQILWINISTQLFHKEFNTSHPARLLTMFSDSA